MGTLNVGRVVLPADPAAWSDNRNFDAHTSTIKGYIGPGLTVDAAKALRYELLQQQGMIVSLTYTLDSSMDGFYILNDVKISTIETSFMRGFFPYEISLTRIGSDGATEWQSLMTGTVRVNNHGLILSEVTGSSIHAPARLHVAYNVDGGAATQSTRSTEHGNLNVYTGLGFDADPTWSVAPTNFYSSAAYIMTGGTLRAGLDMPNSITNFETGNRLVKMTPSLTASVNDGRWDMSWWTGAAYNGPFSFEIYLDGNRIPEWHYSAPITNTPEAVRFRMIRDANDPASIYRHQLDWEIRRGCAFVSFYYSFNDGLEGPTDHDIQIKLEGSSTAMTSITPTGASSACARQVADQSWLIGSAKTVTVPHGGGIHLDGIPADFFIGFELSNTGIDTAESMCLQYHAPLSVIERVVRR